MTSNALKISVIPQERVKEAKKTGKSKSLVQQTANASNKSRKQKAESTLSLFSQMLIQAQQSPTNQTSQTKTKASKNHASSHSATQRKAQLIQSQKTLLTQNKIKMQKPAPSHEMQNQLREALMIKSDQKTTRDIKKIAKDQNLNLSKLEITQKDSKEPRKPLSKEKSPQVSQNANPAQTKSLAKTHQKNKIELPLSKDSSNANQIASNATPEEHQPQTPNQLSQNSQIAKDATLASLLSTKDKEEILNNQEKTEEKKGEKSQDSLLSEVKKETQFKIAQSRETLNHFSQRLKEEIANYKPPFSKLSMELNPQELGKLEITITKKGKELQVNVNANNPNALQAFIQNQSEFKTTLTNIGFNSVELNFSQGDSQQQKERKEEQNQKGNKNGFEELKETPLATSMEIKMVQYA